MMESDALLELLDIVDEHFSQGPPSVIVGSQTMKLIRRIQAKVERVVRAHKRKRRHQRALARRKRRGIA